jgi:hypothetical protein
MIILKHRQTYEILSYYLFFEWKDMKGAGFSFPCNKEGNLVHELNPCAQENYRKCLTGEIEVKPGRIEECLNRWTEPTIGQCHCGSEVELRGFTNTCDQCYTDYNQSGSELADRSQWGDDTNESLGDILRIK